VEVRERLSSAASLDDLRTRAVRGAAAVWVSLQLDCQVWWFGFSKASTPSRSADALHPSAKAAMGTRHPRGLRAGRGPSKRTTTQRVRVKFPYPLGERQRLDPLLSHDIHYAAEWEE